MKKNNQFKRLNKLIKSGKSHAGFTLIELLSGLIMSTIVVAGLGFGLYQLTKITRDEGNKIKARNEILRAREFISDELRRAQTLEVDTSLGNLNNIPDGVAQAYTLPSNTTNGTPLLALQIPGVAQSIIYTIARPNASSKWKGPLVLYRWGPNMNASGEYNDPTTPLQWNNEPLIDGIDDSTVTLPEPCVVNANTTITSYKGFFACMEDDDGDGVPETELTDTDGDGVLENDDIDGLSITAKLYFASDIDIANGDNTKYEANTQVVARARTRNTNEAEEGEGTPIYFKTLGAEYSLGTIGGADCNGKTAWTMRTDFINDTNLGTSTPHTPKTWIHDPDRQGQQININTADPLTISSIPFIPSADYVHCQGSILSRGNETGVDGTPSLHEKLAPDFDTWTPKDSNLDGIYDYETSDFTIDFDDPTTFNGTDDDNPDPGVDHVRIYKKGSVIEYIKDGTEIPLDGYDDYYDSNDSSTDDGEYSLGEFLAFKGYAVKVGDDYRLVNDDDNLATNPMYGENSLAHPTLIKLEDTERIVAVEIGQVDAGPVLGGTTTYNPGFDLQDNVFILSIDKFDSNPDDR